MPQQIDAFGGWEAVFGAIADGRWGIEVAEAIGCSYRMLLEIVKADAGLRERWDAACLLSAEADAVRAREVIDALPANATTAQVAQMHRRAAHHYWCAKMKDRRRFGDQQEITVRRPVEELSDDELAAEAKRLEEQLGARQAAAGPVH